MGASVRRVVTGHSAGGRAVIVEDGPPARSAEIGGPGGVAFFEIWNTRETPARIDRVSGEPPEEGIRLAPPRNGTRIRIVDFPPEQSGAAEATPEEARARFAEIGAADASSHGQGSRHPAMHRTETIDYGIVLDGEIVLVLDEDETVVRAGDVVVQRGTNHAWSNRSERTCRMAFVLIDGRFDPDIA